MKRLFDIILSFLGLAALLPLFLVVALLIKLDSRGPVFFSQERIGRNFVPFALYKFRTMTADAPSRGPAITAGGDSRITRTGRLLRKSKLDELPQLINVLKGDMSLVGPRPEVRKYVDLFHEDYQDILFVRPGITDYAAIEFRDEEEILRGYGDPEEGYIQEVLPAKIQLYKKYIANCGLGTDIKLIIKTFCRIAG